MATDALVLAGEVATALGHPGDITSQVQGWATGLLEELTQNGLATFGGAPTPHFISGMSGASMAAKVALYAGYPFVSPTLLGYCTGIVLHIQSFGIVTYAGPPVPPGASWFLGGIVSGLSGPLMATSVAAFAPYPGTTPLLIAKCTAIAAHIMLNAEVISGVIS